MGGTSFDKGNSIITDANGNIYSIGEFRMVADMDPGIGVANLTSSGDADIYIQKLNPNGELLWANRIGGSTYDYGISITIDLDGNIYTTGYFGLTAEFESLNSSNKRNF
ncbi:MAG: SBBP repeat-containing protein [Crocinitomicaceae bacterium]|nr:SBBP repeat-containing protein [Crocinitomicaceae bacterium]